MPVSKDSIPAALFFLGSPVWADIKRAIGEFKPLRCQIDDTPDIAAAKGHQRAGWEKAIEAIEHSVSAEGLGGAETPIPAPIIAMTSEEKAYQQSLAGLAERVQNTDLATD